MCLIRSNFSEIQILIDFTHTLKKTLICYQQPSGSEAQKEEQQKERTAYGTGHRKYSRHWRQHGSIA